MGPGLSTRTISRSDKEINMNKPSVIEDFIRHFLNAGWDPENAQKPFMPENAFQYLEILDFPRS